MAILPISNVINVTIQGTPQGLQQKNVNSLMLFSTEIPSNIDEYRIYLTPSTVGTDYGTSSKTFAMANAIFAQTPNILTGKGRLIIAPLQSSVSATLGKFQTTDISASTAAFKLISNGEFNITINGGTPFNVLGLNFTGITTLADIKTIIQKKLIDINLISDATTVTFNSKKVGSASAISIAAVSGGSGTDITGATYLNVSAGTATVGANATGETISDAILRLQEKIDFVGIISNLRMEDAIISSLASVIQARDNLFFEHFVSTEDIAGEITTIKSASQKKTRALLYTDDPDTSLLFKSAYVSRAMSVNFSAANSSSTMHLKALANVTPDSNINQTLKISSDTAGSDMYVNFGAGGSVFSSGGNDFFDNQYNQLWLKFGIEAVLFNVLKQTNTKGPQTEQGMTQLKSALAGFLNTGILNGVIGTGLTWNSTETFGDPEDFKRNIFESGYFIYSLPIAQQPQAERELRKAPALQVAIKFAGAIHSVDVIVNINN